MSITYFSEESDLLSKRGIKNVSIYGSFDGKKYDHIKDTKLGMAKSKDDKEKISIDQSYRYFKWVIPTEKGCW